MLLIALFAVGFAAPLVSSSTRALVACAALAGVLFIAVAAVGATATESGSMVGAVGVLTIGLLAGGVARGLFFRDNAIEDRLIRRSLPRELPPRYR